MTALAPETTAFDLSGFATSCESHDCHRTTDGAIPRKYAVGDSNSVVRSPADPTPHDVGTAGDSDLRFVAADLVD